MYPVSVLPVISELIVVSSPTIPTEAQRHRQR